MSKPKQPIRALVPGECFRFVDDKDSPLYLLLETTAPDARWYANTETGKLASVKPFQMVVRSYAYIDDTPFEDEEGAKSTDEVAA